MNKTIFPHFLRKALLTLGGMVVITSSQCWAYDEYQDFILAKIGNTHATTSEFTPGQTLAIESGQSFTLAYGFQENYLRILVELNATTADAQLEAAPAAQVGSIDSYSVFYDVFWAPSFHWYNLSGLIGGGIGYSQTKLDGLTVGADTEDAVDDIKDVGWKAKLGIGLEYRPLKNLGVQLMYENVITDKVEDEEVPGWTLEDTDHTEVSLGVLYQF